MWERTIMWEEKEEKEIKAVHELWRTVLETLKAMKAEREVACAAARMLALEPGKDHTPKPGTLARVFRLPAEILEDFPKSEKGEILTKRFIFHLQISRERDHRIIESQNSRGCK